MNIKRLLVFLWVMAWFTLAPARAEVPDSVNYQAFLTDSGGAPLDETIAITFAMYTSASGGTPKWSETLDVDVDQGLLSVELGAGAVPFSDDLFSSPLWLGLRVGTDQEMTPRRAMTSVSFALKAGDAQTLDGNSVDDVLEFAQSGGIPAGARIPVLALSLNSQDVDLTGLDMALDGRSLSVLYLDQPPISQAIWAPLVLEYTYPLQSASPLGLMSGSGVLYNSVDLLLADNNGYRVSLSGMTIVTRSFTSQVVDAAPAARTSGAQLVHESVALEGDFSFSELTAPAGSGPLEVVISRTGSSDVLQVAGRGPLTSAFEASGPGQGSPFPFKVLLAGAGPGEMATVLNDYLVPDDIALTMRLSGTPLPSASACRVAGLQGLSPAVLDDGGTPVQTLQIDELEFECLGLSDP